MDEYLREWRLWQTFAIDARDIEREILALEEKWRRVQKLATQHHDIFLKIMEHDNG